MTNQPTNKEKQLDMARKQLQQNLGKQLVITFDTHEKFSELSTQIPNRSELKQKVAHDVLPTLPDIFESIEHTAKENNISKEEASILVSELILENTMTPMMQSPTYLNKQSTFAFPSHAITFFILAAFAGLPSRVSDPEQKQLLRKPDYEMSPEKQDKLLRFFFEVEQDRYYTGDGRMEIEENYVAIVSDNPKIKATAKLTSQAEDTKSRALALTQYLRQTFGAEGLRHFLGFIIALEENGRQGYFEWSVNEHLERLGYKKQQQGAFDPELKRKAIVLRKIFTSLKITIVEKKNNKTILHWERLFNEEGGSTEKSIQNTIIEEKVRIHANRLWYQNALSTQNNNKSIQYTKLLKEIAKECHRDQALTIYLTPLLAVFWRQNAEQKMSVKSLMDWCDLDYRPLKEGGDRYRLERLRILEKALNYMQTKGYLGKWSNSGEMPLPSACQDPFDSILTLTPPDWLRAEIIAIEEKREKFLPIISKTQKARLLSKEEFIHILENSDLSIQEFAEKIGLRRETVSRIKNGKKEISPKISAKVRKVFNLDS